MWAFTHADCMHTCAESVEHPTHHPPWLVSAAMVTCKKWKHLCVSFNIRTFEVILFVLLWWNISSHLLSFYLPNLVFARLLDYMHLWTLLMRTFGSQLVNHSVYTPVQEFPHPHAGNHQLEARVGFACKLHGLWSNMLDQRPAYPSTLPDIWHIDLVAEHAGRPATRLCALSYVYIHSNLHIYAERKSNDTRLNDRIHAVMNAYFCIPSFGCCLTNM